MVMILVAIMGHVSIDHGDNSSGNDGDGDSGDIG